MKKPPKCILSCESSGVEHDSIPGLVRAWPGVQSSSFGSGQMQLKRWGMALTWPASNGLFRISLHLVTRRFVSIPFHSIRFDLILWVLLFPFYFQMWQPRSGRLAGELGCASVVLFGQKCLINWKWPCSTPMGNATPLMLRPHTKLPFY